MLQNYSNILLIPIICFTCCEKKSSEPDRFSFIKVSTEAIELGLISGSLSHQATMPDTGIKSIDNLLGSIALLSV
jgi:hypothetical protein